MTDELDTVIEGLGSPRSVVRELAAELLEIRCAETRARGALPLLAAMVRDEHPAERWATEVRAEARLIHAKVDGFSYDAPVQAAAARALLAIDREHHGAPTALVCLAVHGLDGERRDAIRQFERRYGDDSSALGWLVGYLESEQSVVEPERRLRAIAAMGLFETLGVDAVKLLQEIVKGEDEEQAAVARDLLEQEAGR